MLLFLQAWLNLMEQAVEETAAAQIMLNNEAQHKYLTWRAEKVRILFVILIFFPRSPPPLMTYIHYPMFDSSVNAFNRVPASIVTRNMGRRHVPLSGNIYSELARNTIQIAQGDVPLWKTFLKRYFGLHLQIKEKRRGR